MTKKLLLLSLLLIGGLFVSCSSDNSGENTPTTPPVVIDPTPAPITITSVSSEFLIIGENLEITGTNFINKDNPTKIFINDIEVTPKEITSSKILISYSDVIKTGANNLKIQIQKVSSAPLNFFVIAKGWNKLSVLGDIDINTSSVFDNSNTLFSYVKESLPVKLEPKSSGYVQASLNVAGSFGAFKMFDDKRGVLTTTTQAIYSEDGFQTYKLNNMGSMFNPIINGLRIGYLDDKISIINTQLSSQIYTADNGATIIKNDSPGWSKIVTENSLQARAIVYGFGKSTSDGKFYQVGYINDYKKYGNKYKNLIMESATGYSDWIAKDTISNAVDNSQSGFKFININKIVSLHYTDKSLSISTDMLKTWTKIKENVTAFFLRTETQWYIQSGDKLFVTKDSGANWELELELPAGSVVNDISFSKTKIIVSGKKGLHYLKIE